MFTRNVLYQVLAIIALLFVACSGGDTLSVAKVSSPDPTATPVPTPTKVLTATPEPADSVELGLDLGSFEDVDLAELIQEVTNSSELMECLRFSMGIINLIEVSERQNTEVEMALILPCFTDDQIDSIFGGPRDLISPPEPFASLEPIPTDAPVARNLTA